MGKQPANPGTETADAAPGLTIVVLTRNRSRLLRGCLESLRAQEDPGFPLAVVIVDDGSTDDTAQVARAWTAAQPSWRYVPQEHRGIAAARNTGIGHSRTAWTAIVADDYLLPANYARTIAAFFQEHAQAMVVRFQVVAAGGGLLQQALHAYQEAGVLRRLAAPGGTGHPRRPWQPAASGGRITTAHGLEAAGAAAFRSAVFRQVDGFDESFVRGEDSEFTRRLRAAGIPVHYFPGLEIRHRNNPRLGNALKNVFQGGRAAWRLQAHPGSGRASVGRLLRLALRSVPAALYGSCWRSWQTGRPLRMFAYFPVMLLLESGHRAGLVSAGIASRRKAPPEAAAAARP